LFNQCQVPLHFWHHHPNPIQRSPLVNRTFMLPHSSLHPRQPHQPTTRAHTMHRTSSARSTSPPFTLVAHPHRALLPQCRATRQLAILLKSVSKTSPQRNYTRNSKSSSTPRTGRGGLPNSKLAVSTPCGKKVASPPLASLPW
jgi:hypothetical protein